MIYLSDLIRSLWKGMKLKAVQERTASAVAADGDGDIVCHRVARPGLAVEEATTP